MYSDQNFTAMIVPFYLGEKSDLEGRKIQQMWAWDFEELECAHDYIQWLFPIAEKSHFNPHAPVVDEDVIQAFRENPHLQKNLLQSFSVMLHFYGLAISRDEQGKVVVEKSENYPDRKQEWVNMLNHNYLRITRILKCLIAFGFIQEAHAFYECLQKIYREDSDQIGGETFQYWTGAVNSV
ncbi:opioid growth factor receptor family protein [Leptolyngbya sp. PCC 7375]|nr:opioid growth factor receptor family protein [Leptolyngbya sp. PCC 7375]